MILSWLQVVHKTDIRNMRYCDVGANHATELSNTFLFYSMGATGVLIEPDAELCKGLRSARPRDIVLNVGVAFDERRSAKLQRMTARVFNTFSPDQANLVIDSSKDWHPDQRQELLDEVDVPLIPANEILEKYFSNGIDFLSIDAEGVDLPIIRSIDLQRFRPKIICIEASADFSSIIDVAGYERIARTPDNFIYCRNY